MFEYSIIMRRWQCPDASRQEHGMNAVTANRTARARLQPTGGQRMLHSMRQFKANVFQALAHPTRIAVVELLSTKSEVSVTQIQEQLGLEQANASQHLAILRSRQIVVARKDGNQVFYSLRDPILGQILTLMKKYFQSHVNESLQMIKNLERDFKTRR
jgi:ArsR family transcriptional regulator